MAVAGRGVALQIPSTKNYFPAVLPLPQEDFGVFVLAVRTVQLASAQSCPYTDFAADSRCSSESFSVIRLGLTRRRGHVFDGNPPCRKLSPQKAAFLYRRTSRWRIFGGAFLVQQRGTGECGEIQHRIARVADHSVPPDCGMGSDFSADAVSRRIWDLHLAAREIKRVGISVGGELAVRDATIHGHHRVCLYWLAPLHRALAHARQIDVCECRCRHAESVVLDIFCCRRARFVISSRRGNLGFLVEGG